MKITSFTRHQAKILRIILHLVIWMVMWAIIRYYSVPTLTKDNTTVISIASAVVFTQSLFIFYLSGYVIFPLSLFRKKIFLFLISMLCLYQFIHLVNYFEFHFLARISGTRPDDILYVTRLWKNYLEPNGIFGCFTNFQVAYFNYAWSLFYVTPILVVKIMRDMAKSRTASLQLEKDRLQLEVDLIGLKSKSIQLQHDNIALELGFLKSQVNPHFLFNILNSIFTLTVDQDNKAADLVLMLSDLMRYSLYECSKESVSLSREMEYINSYIGLERSRKSDHIEVEFNTTGDFTQYEIAPLLFISFIENAFKYGIGDSENRSCIRISMQMENDTLIFSAQNTIHPLSGVHAEQKARAENKYSGLGLTNTLARLKLLYPDQHKITIDHGQDLFSVCLKIALKPKQKDIITRAASTSNRISQM